MNQSKDKINFKVPQIFENNLLSDMINSFNQNNENSKLENDKNENINLDFNLINNKKIQDKINIENILREEYPQYFMKEFKTPIEFKYSKNPLQENANKNNENIILDLLNKYQANFNYNELIKKINLVKWLFGYTILTGNQIKNVCLVLNHFKNNFSFNSNSTVCEVKEVIIIDCLQVLTVIDIKIKKKKIILTIYENKNNFLIDDYFLREGDIILFRMKNKDEKYLKLNVKDIQKLC